MQADAPADGSSGAESSPARAAPSSAAAVTSPAGAPGTAARRYYFLGESGAPVDEQLVTDIARSGAFSLEQLTLVVSSVLDCLKSPAVCGLGCDTCLRARPGDCCRRSCLLAPLAAAHAHRDASA